MRKLDSLLITAGFALLSGASWAQGNDQPSDRNLGTPDEVIIIQEMSPDQSDQATMDENAPATAENCLSCSNDEQSQNGPEDESRNDDQDDQQ